MVIVMEDKPTEAIPAGSLAALAALIAMVRPGGQVSLQSHGCAAKLRAQHCRHLLLSDQVKGLVKGKVLEPGQAKRGFKKRRHRCEYFTHLQTEMIVGNKDGLCIQAE